MPLLAHLLFGLAAHAQEAARVDPPLPIAGQPWAAEVVAYALPPQDISWFTEEVPEIRCTVEISLQAQGSFAARLGACPEKMGEAALAATRSWAFQVPAGAEGTSQLRVIYAFQYSATLGTTTLHAEIDPSAVHNDLEGVPGLQLSRRAELRAPLLAKLPKAAKRAGLGAETCRVRVVVDAAGRAVEAASAACSESLVADGIRRARKARYSPRTVDAMAYADEIEVEIHYTR